MTKPIVMILTLLISQIAPAFSFDPTNPSLSADVIRDAMKEAPGLRSVESSASHGKLIITSIWANEESAHDFHRSRQHGALKAGFLAVGVGKLEASRDINLNFVWGSPVKVTNTFDLETKAFSVYMEPADPNFQSQSLPMSRLLTNSAVGLGGGLFATLLLLAKDRYAGDGLRGPMSWARRRFCLVSTLIVGVTVLVVSVGEYYEVTL